MKRFLPFLLPVALLLFCIFSSVLIHRSSWFVQDKHFVKLATSFTKGDLFLNPINLPDGDFADYFGKQYLFFGPMPAVILVPFVLLFGAGFPQMFLSLFGLVVTFVGVFLLCRKFKFDDVDSLWLSIFFVFGTVYFFVGVVNISAYVVQAVAVPFVILAILEYFTKRRWFLIGLLTAAAIFTRVTYLGVAVFFVLEILRQRKNIDIKQALLAFLIPILVCVFLLGVYNFRRFHSPFDTGYTRNVSVLNKPEGNWQKGFFSPAHIPGNLYSLFVMAPEVVRIGELEFVLKFPYVRASGWGMSIFLTSPLFVYLLLSKGKEYTRSALISIFALALPSMIYFGIGSAQYGYRYALDFIPLLFLILLSAFAKGVPTFAKWLIFVGVLFNLLYCMSIWNSWPVFDFLAKLWG